jgi:hypothetical protein
MDYFVTEFGHRIDLVPGYFERNRFYSDNNIVRLDKYPRSEPKGGDSRYAYKRWVLFSSMVAFLERHGLLRKFSTALDLGGSEGDYLRLFKAAGIIGEGTVADLQVYDIEQYNKLFRVFLMCARNLDQVNERALSAIKNTVTEAKADFDFLADTEPFEGLHLQFPYEGTIDKAIAGDAMNLGGAYDLVTAFNFLYYLDLDDIFLKMRELLNPGGLFASFTSYFWWPVTNAGLVANFPYVAQRLTFQDTVKYFTKYQPDDMKNLEERYFFYHSRKNYNATVADWVSAATRHGFRPLACDRASPKRSRRMQTPHELMKEPWFDMNEVLRDAHEIKKAVTTEDLTTGALLLAFTR